MLKVRESETIEEICRENPDIRRFLSELEDNHKFTISKISHEIRNPVTLINSFLQLLEVRYPELSGDDYWKKVMDNMQFLRSLLDELSSYNNSNRVVRSEANIYAILSEIVGSARPTLEQDQITIQLIKKTALPTLPLDTVKMQQTFYNFIRNAHEAIGTHGAITISLETDGSDITIQISDTVKGIPAEHMSELFKPFVTYKKDGTGLGLSIAKGVIEAHNGTIQVDSTEGEGTTISVILPIC